MQQGWIRGLVHEEVSHLRVGDLREGAVPFEGLVGESGGARLDVYYNSLGPSGLITYWTIVDHERKSVRVDQDSSSAVSNLRGAQALPGRGAWFYSHL